MTRKPQIYRVRFFGPVSTLHEAEVSGIDIDAAVRAATQIPWPPAATGFRLIDVEGREVFTQLKADRP
jgi:hypothetical protein